jgi:DNA-binding MarR family transcriptional regulator
MLSRMQPSAGTQAPRAGVAPDVLAEAILGFWKQLMRSGGNRGFFSVLEELDLSATQAKVLFTLTGCGDAELTVKDVADLVPTSLPNASRTVDLLLRRGLVERREDPDDRRQKRLRATPAAHEVVERIDEVRLADLGRFCAGLDPADRARLHAVLTDLPHAKDPAR